MGAVAAGGAVERVAVGNGGVGAVVGITDEVVAASNLGAVDESGVCGGQLGELGCLLVVFELAATAEVGVGVVDTGVDDGDLHALTGVSARAGGVGGAGPGGEGACVNGGARVLAVLGQDGRDFLYVGAVGECLDGLGVTAYCHAAYCVVGGVEDLRAGLAADLLCLALHLGGDGLHLRAGVDGCLRAGAYACGLGLFKGALTLEADEGGDGAAGVLHAVTDDLLLDCIGVFGGLGGGAERGQGAQRHAEGEDAAVDPAAGLRAPTWCTRGGGVGGGHGAPLLGSRGVSGRRL